MAYVFGKRKDEVFKALKVLLEPFGISCYYTDDWGAYQRHLESDKYQVGKRCLCLVQIPLELSVGRGGVY